MSGRRALTLAIILVVASSAGSLCNNLDGGNRRVVCSYTSAGVSSGQGFGFWLSGNLISECVNGSSIGKAVSRWIASDPKLNESVSRGLFDEPVKALWTKAYGLYGFGSRYGGGSCDNVSSEELLANTHSTGSSVQWSALLFSLMRGVGVPSERVGVWEYTTPLGGHAVTAYLTDSGNWWVMDATCCNALVPLSAWKSYCGVCSCVERGCIALVSDAGVHTVDYGTGFDAGIFSSACGC